MPPSTWKGGVYVYEKQSLRETDRKRGLIEEAMMDKHGIVIAVGDTPAAGPAPGREAALSVALSFGQEPSRAPEWCVSYAWADDTPDGRDRAAIVDRLCVEASAQGIRILRDKDAMGLGERISKFMKRIGGANRVFHRAQRQVPEISLLHVRAVRGVAYQSAGRREFFEAHQGLYVAVRQDTGRLWSGQNMPFIGRSNMTRWRLW